MGVVYRADDTHLDRFIVLKLLPPDKVADTERKRRFVQEARGSAPQAGSEAGQVAAIMGDRSK